MKRSKVGARPTTSGPAAPVAPIEAPTFLGRYELLFEIGRGGMGSVHAARTRDEHGVERVIALKCLPRERATKDALAALTAEAKITATIDHPNVVDTFEFGVDDGSAWIAMRLIEGVPLSRAIERAAECGERIPPALASWIVAQAARGLHAAHALTTKSGERFGIVHRDVSPANLLVSREGRVYVVDFGIAKLLANDIHTVSGVIKGKFAYMSPEQTRGSDVDPRSDIFSLGVVFYELLTGISPFRAAHPAESIHRINNVDPEDVRRIATDVPEAVAAIVRRCLSRDADDRFRTANELADALRQAARAERDTTDEADVAAWIERVAGEDLRALRDRIAESARKPMRSPPPATSVVVTASTDEATEGRERERSVDTSTPSRSRRTLVAGGAALVAIAAVTVGLATRSTTASTRSPLSTSPSTTSAKDARVTPIASDTAPNAAPSSTAARSTEVADPRAPESASTVASTAASLVPTSSAPPPLGPRSAASAPLPAPTTSAAPAKSSHKGEPFRTLGG